ncbi:hypothetical protein BZA77DRAFT_270927 [Pyronema omphalodes]|nr:hypothetical protein BZA77DRAFT_270927 [Pyronema omphalodes]
MSATTTSADASTKVTPEDTEFVPHGDVTSTLSFYAAPTDGSSPAYFIPPVGEPTLNFGESLHPVRIHDIRTHKTPLSLDHQAFNLHVFPSQLQYPDYEDETKIHSLYYPEIENIIKTHVPGAEDAKVIIFDHTLRRSHANATRKPVLRAHIDQTARSAALRLRRHMTEAEAQAVEEKGERYMIINVWRPINGTVVSHPLAFADSSTVRDSDLVPVKHVYPDYEGETASVRYGDWQRWWYVSGQTQEEVTLIKCFDSERGEMGFRRVPHTAFVHPDTKEGARGRESIEVRCLVVGVKDE